MVRYIKEYMKYLVLLCTPTTKNKGEKKKSSKELGEGELPGV